MNNSAKKILYATIVAALFMTYQAQPTFCDEKINAGVVYEFYLDVGNQIPANKPIDTKKLPEINTQEVNLAYYKGFRPLNLLSAKNVYTISAPKDKKLKYEKIPKEYSISLNPQKIAAAAKITPTYEEYLALAVNFKGKEKYNDALTNIDGAIEKNPLSMEAHFLKADILRCLNRYKDSIIEYMLAINIDPKCTDAYFNIAKIFESSGNDELALEYYRYAYSTKPDDYEIRNIILGYEKSKIN